ncbi:MAG TPA: SusD/RagB family nutrient-binding outer membrane lipoprotein [Chitinophagaceae bacterium]
MKKYIIITAITALAFTSCKKTLDVNTDPDNPGVDQATPTLVLPSGIASAAGRIGGDLAILGGIWAQYYTQGTTASQYRDVDAFNVTKSYGQTTTGVAWVELYSGALNDLNFVVNKSKQEQNWNYFLMGTVIKTYTLQVLVDLYDKVPYSEAFQGAANLQPHFDDGYTVYKGLLAELDSALNKDFDASTNSIAGTNDFIFPDAANSWSIEPWVRFANTLKLKMYLRMAYAKPADAQAGIQKLYTDGALFLNQDAQMDVFVNAPDKANPFYSYNFLEIGTDANLKASVTFLSWLQVNGDPRLNDYYFPATNSPNYLAINQGDFFNTDAALNGASKARVDPTDPVEFISLAESHFLQAEALEKYYGGAGAKSHYDAGVTASFARYGDNPASFLAAGGRYVYPSGTAEQKLEAIITQKYASFPGSHALEGWLERNRTGYPRISTVYSTSGAYVPGQLVYPKNGITNGVFAKRLIWPDLERSKNANTPAEEPLTAKVWWDVR